MQLMKSTPCCAASPSAALASSNRLNAVSDPAMLPYGGMKRGSRRIASRNASTARSCCPNAAAASPTLLNANASRGYVFVHDVLSSSALSQACAVST